jgi:hypothetical protein
MTETTRETTNAQARAAVVAAAVISTMLVWLVADLLGLHASVTMNETVQSISGITVAVATIVASVSAWLVKASLDRVLRNPTPAWLVIAIAVGLLSLTGPLTMATSAGAAAVLVALHLVPAAILVPGLASTRPVRRRSTLTTAAADAAPSRKGYGGAP